MDRFGVARGHTDTPCDYAADRMATFMLSTEGKHFAFITAIPSDDLSINLSVRARSPSFSLASELRTSGLSGGTPSSSSNIEASPSRSSRYVTLERIEGLISELRVMGSPLAIADLQTEDGRF